MSDFDQMQYQATARSELTHIIQTQMIPNALLFSGNENTGKKEAAFLFAKGCNCLTGLKTACNRCRSCRKIDAGSHPDILCIDLEQDKQAISITQIREMGAALCSKPNEARFRMVLILAADLMTVQAQNALLKQLEEPPERTAFILIACKISALLPTILSRCRQIRFKPLTDTLIEQRLTADFNIDRQLAHIVSRTADTDLKKAMAYLNLDTKQTDIDWVKRRKWLLDSLCRIIRAGTGKGIASALLLSQRLSRHPDFIDDAVSIMKTLFRDLMIFTLDPKKIVNLDFFDTFTDINQRIRPEQYFEWIKNLYELEKRLASNSTPRLTLDRFFLNLVTKDIKL